MPGRPRGRRRAWNGLGSCFYQKPVTIRHSIARWRCCATRWRSRTSSRSYLISISFTAPSADEAARVVNAFAIEYAREKSKQSIRDMVTTAEAELVRQRALNGERHPKVLQAADELSAVRAALAAGENAEGDGQDTIVADEGVTLAIPNRTPTSPKGSVTLGLALILGFLSGVGLAVWRDRLGFEPHRRLRDVLRADLRFGQHSVGDLLARFLTLCRDAARNFVGGLHARFLSLCRHAARARQRSRARLAKPR